MNETIQQLVLQSIVTRIRRREYDKVYNKAYYEEHKEKMQVCSKAYYTKHKEEKRKYHEAYNTERPWRQHWQGAKMRCENPKHRGYKYYGGRGIKFLLTIEEIKTLYLRDKAKDMKCATLDRIDNDGNYCFENCRFIEKSENTRKGASK